MTQPRDIERLLDQWFADGSSVAPDRVIDVVADRIERQPQRPAWRLDWRHLSMSTTFKLAAAMAAVLAIAVVGYSFLPGNGSGVGSPTTAPTPSAQPTAAVTAAPTPSPTFVYPSGILSPGSHATASFLPAFTFTLPEPWVLDGDTTSYYSLFPDSPANRAEWARTGNTASGLLIASELDRPYFVCEAWEDNRGATAAEMVAAMVANEALATSEPVDVTIGGLTGKQVDVQLDPGWTDSCPGDPPTLDLGDQRTRVILLDTADRGVIVIFVGSLHAAGHEAFLAKAMPIIESFQFDLTP